jgi:hypothetical protein
MKRNRKFSLLFISFLINFILFSQEQSTPKILEDTNHFLDKSVRVIYLISSDKSFNQDYYSALEKAALSVQDFYRKELNGLTFRLNNPIVEVLFCDKPSDYFYSHPSDPNEDNWGYFNAYNEVHQLLGAKFFDENYTWAIYSDGPGDKGRGGSSVCVMPEDDLIGLIGKHQTQPDINRWYGGLAHELGHAFGLNHPIDTDNNSKAIMWTGIYGYYPNEAYFTEEDKNILIKSSFIKNSELIINYPEGYFKGSNLINANWIEYKNESIDKFEFTLIQESPDYLILKSNDRSLHIKLPRISGQSYISIDNCNTWQHWWYLD